MDTSQRLPPPDSVLHHLRYWFPCKLRYLRPQHPRISGYHTLGVFGCSLFEKRPNSSHPSPRAPAPVSPPLATKSRSAPLHQLPTSIPSDWDTVPLVPPSPPAASPSHRSDSRATASDSAPTLPWVILRLLASHNAPPSSPQQGSRNYHPASAAEERLHL